MLFETRLTDTALAQAVCRTVAVGQYRIGTRDTPVMLRDSRARPGALRYPAVARRRKIGRMLLGRAQERELLQHLIEGARRKTAGVLLLRAEPGIGKTKLVTFAAEVAEGFRVLQIQGHESETGIPFAGLSWLLDPLTGLLTQLPRVQAAALAGALQLGPAAGGDRLAVAAATLTLLAAAADEQPLLIAVDDAHWIDIPSLEAIVFASRRLQAEAIAMVITARSAVDVPTEVNRLLEALPGHQIPGLEPDAARELLATQHVSMSPELLSERVAESAGNPLALLELPTLGEGTLPVEPLRIGNRLEQAFAQRVAMVPPSARQAMLLVAAAGASTVDVLVRALDLYGLSPADLEPAETAGLLVSTHSTVRFHHPLVRSAVYQSASPAERRGAHRVLAEVFGSLSAPGRKRGMPGISLPPPSDQTSAVPPPWKPPPTPLRRGEATQQRWTCTSGRLG